MRRRTRLLLPPPSPLPARRRRLRSPHASRGDVVVVVRRRVYGVRVVRRDRFRVCYRQTIATIGFQQRYRCWPSVSRTTRSWLPDRWKALRRRCFREVTIRARQGLPPPRPAQPLWRTDASRFIIPEVVNVLRNNSFGCEHVNESVGPCGEPLAIELLYDHEPVLVVWFECASPKYPFHRAARAC